MKFSDLIESKIKSEGDFFEAKSIAMHVLAEFVNREDHELDVMDIDLSGGEFVIYSEDEAYSLSIPLSFNSCNSLSKSLI